MGKRHFAGKKTGRQKANNIAAANGKEIEIQRRHTVDFRRVNNRTQPKAGHIPYIEDVVKNLAGSAVHGKFDLDKSFWQLPSDQKAWDILDSKTVWTHTKVKQTQ
jgi:hypothetical protein